MYLLQISDFKWFYHS